MTTSNESNDLENGASLLILALLLSLGSCNQQSAAAAEKQASKAAVLLVSHGSHSETWRETLYGVEDAVEDELVALPQFDTVHTAFMEYTEPSIATRLRELDADGYDEVVLVPVLLTVSSHSFDDIPTIYGAKHDVKSVETLEAEGIERYTPTANVTMTPLLDFPTVLEENVARRARSLSEDLGEEGIVLVAYGSEPFDEEWTAMMVKLGEHLKSSLGVGAVEHAWCGHIARYSREPTKDAIHKVLERAERALVIPVLVAFDEDFQIEIIGGAVEECDAPSRVLYRPDSILPDENVRQWIVDSSRETIERLRATR